MAASGARSLPSAATQRLRVEACRASVLALHAAAGLASGPDADRQLLRVLRSAEALARSAVVLASLPPKSAAPISARSSPGGDAALGVDDAVPCAAGGSRWRRRKSKKKKKVVEDVAMVESTRQPVEVLRQPTPKPLDSGTEAFVPPVAGTEVRRTAGRRGGGPLFWRISEFTMGI